MGHDRPQLFTLSNGDRQVTFRGVRVAHASSREGRDLDALRWTEVDVYRTAGGQYVLHKVGKSRVYHAGPTHSAGVGWKKTTAYQVVQKATSAQLDNLEPCPVCKPGSMRDLARQRRDVLMEVEHGTTSVSSTPQGVVESAYSSDGDGVRYLTRVAERALRQASDVDAGVRDAFMVERVA